MVCCVETCPYEGPKKGRWDLGRVERKVGNRTKRMRRGWLLKDKCSTKKTKRGHDGIETEKDEVGWGLAGRFMMMMIMVMMMPERRMKMKLGSRNGI